MITDILQPTHLIFLLVVALLVLGPKRLPEAGKALGKGIRSFRGAVDGIQDEASHIFSHDDHDETDETAAPAAEIVEPETTDVHAEVHESDVATDSEHAPTEETEPEPAGVAPATVIEPAAVAPATVIEPTLVSSTSRASDD